ncbi:putative sulfate exporter family transporter [Virgibacillus sp. 179-BFC.A HS]|uniref:Sulfate exporter family transporter n=1 Tax=Tigheibacillus jepli TaxID=3035914 RepID=A0ABU5CL17_9BACI|nr:putative sulfate exporter family transporter [Virgibacillus sp. 179-BFC.A HS]MDY0407019.1 putative sulfate exporter family transporter [Virgibacillus sp. 179-BFC.A HS]
MRTNQSALKMEKQNAALKWIAGIAFTFFIALLGYLLSLVPGFNRVGQLACAIIIAVIYRQLFGYPEAIRNGITFSSKKLLRLAIILYGLKLNIAIILKDGLGLLARDALVIAFAILLTVWLAKLLKADKMISLLLGVGTGVCGAAAIAAVAPIVKSKDEDTAIGVGIIALMGTIFAIGYTILRPFLPLSDIDYGVWSGSSLHELAHVAIAAAPAGDQALAIGLLAKLGRVFLLVPLCFIFIYFMKRKGANEENSKVEFPWFLVGFVVMSLLGSYVFGHAIPMSGATFDNIAAVTTWILTAAMVGLGLNVSLQDVRSRALKPLLAMTITSVCLSILVFFIV